MIRIRIRAAVTAAGLVVALAAGCANQPANPPVRPIVGVLTESATAGSTYQQFAARTATSLLDSFVPPSGAKPESAEPAGGTPGMAGVFVFTSSEPDWVESTGWWVVDQSPAALETWLKGDLPKFLPDNPTSSSGADGKGLLMAELNESVSNMGLYEEDLGAQIGSYPGGESVLRLDSVAYYRPTRSAAERIADVTSLTVTSLVGPASATITDQTEISAVVALVNAEPALPDAPYSCPADTGGGLQLVFRPIQPSAPEIVAVIGLTGCGGTSVETGGVAQPALDGPTVGQVTAILGLNWDLNSTSPANTAG